MGDLVRSSAAALSASTAALLPTHTHFLVARRRIRGAHSHADTPSPLTLTLTRPFASRPLVRRYQLQLALRSALKEVDLLKGMVDLLHEEQAIREREAATGDLGRMQELEGALKQVRAVAC